MNNAEQVFHARGLGELVRQTWAQERINPPEGASNQAVWWWLNRVDVAWCMALALTPDTRLLLVVAAGMARSIVRFLGGPSLETVEVIPLLAYGLEEGRWRSALVGFNSESIALGQRPQPSVVSGPGGEFPRPKTWQEDARMAAVYCNGAMHLFSQRAPAEIIRSNLDEASKHAWRGWRSKLRDVDGMRDELAKTMANQILLKELREVIQPSVFSSVCLWRRRAGQ